MKRLLIGFCLVSLILISACVVHDTSIASRSLKFEQIESGTNQPSNQIAIKWRVLHPPVDYFLEAAKTFKLELENLSDGELTVEIIVVNETQIPNSGVIAQEAEEMILNGTTDMMQIGISNLVEYNLDLLILTSPYMFTSDEHVDLVVDGEIGDELLREINNSKLKALAFTFSGGFETIVSKRSDIKKLSDLKGQRALVYGPDFGILANELGMEIVPAIKKDNWTKEIPDSLAAGIEGDLIDAWEQTAQDAKGMLDQGVSKSIINSNHRVWFTVLAINREFFDGLSTEQQHIVEQAAKKAAIAERHAISSDGKKALSQYSYLENELSKEDIELLKDVKEKAIATRLKNVDPAMLKKIVESSP